MSATRKPRRKKRDVLAKTPLGRCPLTGKRRWETRAAARDHQRHLKAIGDRRAKDLGTYHCREGCGNWHVGHRSKGQREDAA